MRTALMVFLGVDDMLHNDAFPTIDSRTARHASCLRAWTLVLVLGSLPLSHATAAPQDGPQTLLNGRLELPRLVDLCAERLGLAIEYDESALQGTVTLRIGRPVSDDELWTLTNRILAARGFTSVSPDPGGPISIVKISDAAGLAPSSDHSSDAFGPGFTSVIVPITHRSVKTITVALKPMLSPQGGLIQALGVDDLVIISDLASRVNEALRLIELLDVSGTEPIIETIDVQHLGASTLALQVTAATAARNLLADRPLPGTLSPTPDDRRLVLVAPPEALDPWHELIARFDVPQGVVTQTYSPPHFALADVSSLIEETAKEDGPRGSGDRWRMVTDELTGTLVVTATPEEHVRIAALLERLANAPAAMRRPMRSFTIRNRGVSEILAVLTDLMETGVLDAPPEVGASSNAGDTTRPPVQRSSRDPLTSIQQPATAARSTDALATSSTDARATGPAPGRTDRPALTLTADEGTNTLIAVGEPRLLDQLDTLIHRLDVRQPQVMIEVLVVSLSDGDTFDLGLELEKIELSGSTMIQLSSLFGLGGAGSAASGMIPSAGSGFSGAVLSPGDFSVVIRALETINEGRSMSMPRVLVNNNTSATLDSVLQQPFLSTNASDTVATTSFGGTEDAGTTITVTPQIAEGDHLVLEYSVALSTFVGESSDPALPPPRQQNALQSTVTIPDGHTIVVGGLVVETDAEATSKVPLLGDLPGIGAAFSSRSRSRSRSRFYVFIRPNIMRHHGFEDLKYISAQDAWAAGVDDGWPRVEPRIIR